MKPDQESCLCPYCGENLPKKNCADCSHKDFIFEDVCVCPRSETYFIQNQPLVEKILASEDMIFPEWQGPKQRFYQ